MTVALTRGEPHWLPTSLFEATRHDPTLCDFDSDLRSCFDRAAARGGRPGRIGPPHARVGEGVDRRHVEHPRLHGVDHDGPRDRVQLGGRVAGASVLGRRRSSRAPSRPSRSRFAAATLTSPKDGLDKNMHKALKVTEHRTSRSGCCASNRARAGALRAIGMLTDRRRRARGRDRRSRPSARTPR